MKRHVDIVPSTILTYPGIGIRPLLVLHLKAFLVPPTRSFLLISLLLQIYIDVSGSFLDAGTPPGPGIDAF